MRPLPTRVLQRLPGEWRTNSNITTSPRGHRAPENRKNLLFYRIVLKLEEKGARHCSSRSHILMLDVCSCLPEQVWCPSLSAPRVSPFSAAASCRRLQEPAQPLLHKHPPGRVSMFHPWSTPNQQAVEACGKILSSSVSQVDNAEGH